MNRLKIKVEEFSRYKWVELVLLDRNLTLILWNSSRYINTRLQNKGMYKQTIWANINPCPAEPGLTLPLQTV